MFYRCKKVQYKPINIKLGIQFEGAKETKCALVWRTGLSGVPPDSVRCTRPVQGWTSHSRVSAGALRYNSPDYPVCHRAVRCASGATTNSRNGRLCKCEQCSYSATQKSEQKVKGAPDCLVQQDDKAPTVDRAPNPNNWVTWRRTGQLTRHVRWRTGLSIAPIASSLPQRLLGGWGL
jgi:hypothetical protein